MLSSDRDRAFRRFHAVTAVPLWRYVFRTGGDRALADDVVQESFLRLLARPAMLEDTASARPYLYCIASNLLRDRWRRKARRPRVDDRVGPEAPALATASTADETRLRRDVRAVLHRLTPRERALVWLAHVDGYRHSEIAAILGLKTASVKVLLHRAKTKLVALLAADGYHSETPES